MAKVIANQTRTKYDIKTRKPITIIKGQTYNTTSKVYQTFKPEMFDTVSTKRVRYTEDEEWLLAGLIVEGNTPQEVLSKFREVYDTHTDHSINLQYRQAVNLFTNGSQGMEHKTNSFMNKLIALDPYHFQ